VTLIAAPEGLNIQAQGYAWGFVAVARPRPVNALKIQFSIIEGETTRFIPTG